MWYGFELGYCGFGRLFSWWCIFIVSFYLRFISGFWIEMLGWRYVKCSKLKWWGNDILTSWSKVRLKSATRAQRWWLSPQHFVLSELSPSAIFTQHCAERGASVAQRPSLSVLKTAEQALNLLSAANIGWASEISAPRSAMIAEHSRSSWVHFSWRSVMGWAWGAAEQEGLSISAERAWLLAEYIV